MKYNVIHPIEHDNKRTESGEIDLPDDDAAPLLAIGHIAKIAKPAKLKKPRGAGEGGDDAGGESGTPEGDGDALDGEGQGEGN